MHQKLEMELRENETKTRLTMNEISKLKNLKFSRDRELFKMETEYKNISKKSL